MAKKPKKAVNKKVSNKGCECTCTCKSLLGKVRQFINSAVNKIKSLL